MTVRKHLLVSAFVFAAVAVLAPLRAQAQPNLSYYSLYGSMMVPVEAEVGSNDPIPGYGISWILATQRFTPVVTRVGVEFHTSDQRQTLAPGVRPKAEQRIFSGYAEFLYGPRFAVDRSFRWYLGPGIGVFHERLEFSGSDNAQKFEQSYTATSVAFTGTVGVQLEWAELMSRVTATVGANNISVATVLSFGLVFGAFPANVIDI